MRYAQEGDVVLLVSDRDKKQFIRTLEAGRELHTHLGVMKHDELIGQPLGAQVKTHQGYIYYLLTPTTDELIRDLKRESQIIFPKDAGYIIMKLGIKPGTRVLEAGTGSGGLCLTLATMVGDEGHVYSYDIRSRMQKIAEFNLIKADVRDRVTLKLKDANEGFDEEDIDALFLDMLTPWDVLDQAHQALRGSGMLGCLVPTTNQLATMIQALEDHPGFAHIEAEELILRAYKTVPARVRPDERMIGHTGYLIFARALISERDTLSSEDGHQTPEPDSKQTSDHSGEE